MPKSTRSRKADAVDGSDPDKLIRRAAGVYRTADDRFEVREDGGAWFLVDSEQTNEFGQEVVRGPFPSRKAAGEALAEARQPLPTPIKRPEAPARSTRANASPKPAPPKPPRSWIEQLPPRDASVVRSLIRTLEREGVQNPERIVRRDREGDSPEIAASVIARRLAATVEGFPEEARATAREAIRKAVALLTRGGDRVPSPLPGWSLVESGDAPGSSRRRIAVAALLEDG